MRTTHGQFITNKRRNFLRLVVLVLVIWAIWAIVQQGNENNRAYNAHMCAVYGYQPDCATPLK